MQCIDGKNLFEKKLFKQKERYVISLKMNIKWCALNEIKRLFGCYSLYLPPSEYSDNKKPHSYWNCGAYFIL